MRIRDRVMSHNARAMFASLPLETSSDTNIEFLAGNRDISCTNCSSRFSFFFSSCPSSPFLPPLCPFSGAPSRDTPLDSAGLKWIIIVIKRIKVISSCISHSPVSWRVEGTRISWRLSHPHFLFLILSSSPFRLSRLLFSPLYIDGIFTFLVILSAFNFHIILPIKLFTSKSEVMRNISFMSRASVLPFTRQGALYNAHFVRDDKTRRIFCFTKRIIGNWFPKGDLFLNRSSMPLYCWSVPMNYSALVSLVNAYTYIHIYTYTYTHTPLYIYIYIEWHSGSI